MPRISWLKSPSPLAGEGLPTRNVAAGRPRICPRIGGSAKNLGGRMPQHCAVQHRAPRRCCRRYPPFRSRLHDDQESLHERVAVLGQPRQRHVDHRGDVCRPAQPVGGPDGDVQGHDDAAEGQAIESEGQLEAQVEAGALSIGNTTAKGQRRRSHGLTVRGGSGQIDALPFRAQPLRHAP
ncbi:L-lactate dehydrogenase (EC 1.1.2.3) [Azospirillum melinis]